MSFTFVCLPIPEIDYLSTFLLSYSLLSLRNILFLLPPPPSLSLSLPFIILHTFLRPTLLGKTIRHSDHSLHTIYTRHLSKHYTSPASRFLLIRVFFPGGVLYLSPWVSIMAYIPGVSLVSVISLLFFFSFSHCEVCISPSSAGRSSPCRECLSLHRDCPFPATHI